MRSASTSLPALTTKGWGFASSLEAGYPIHLGGGFIVEPQAQIVYQNVSLGDASDTAATVQFRNADSIAARIAHELRGHGRWSARLNRSPSPPDQA